MLEPATSKAADSTAFDHPGAASSAQSAKARNHCQYCKCHSCTFCPAEAIAASKRKNARAMKKKGPFSKPKTGAPKGGAAGALKPKP